MSKIKDKLAALIEENNSRVQKVEEMTMQIETLKTGIATLKEQHDFTRGQISALQDLEEGDSKEKKAETKKG